MHQISNIHTSYQQHATVITTHDIVTTAQDVKVPQSNIAPHIILSIMNQYAILTINKNLRYLTDTDDMSILKRMTPICFYLCYVHTAKIISNIIYIVDR